MQSLFLFNPAVDKIAMGRRRVSLSYMTPSLGGWKEGKGGGGEGGTDQWHFYVKG